MNGSFNLYDNIEKSIDKATSLTLGLVLFLNFGFI